MEIQQLARVQAIVKAKVLGQEADARAHLGIAERRAEHGAAARRRRDEAEQQLQRRRLAGAVRPQKAENLAARDGEGQTGYRDVAAELAPQRRGFDCVFRHLLQSLRDLEQFLTADRTGDRERLAARGPHQHAAGEPLAGRETFDQQALVAGDVDRADRRQPSTAPARSTSFANRS